MTYRLLALRLLVPALCLLLVPAHAQKDAEWRRTTFPKTGLSVLLPGTPKREDKSQTDPKTGAKVLGEYASTEKKDAYSYMAIAMRFNEAARADLARQVPKGADPLAYFAERTFANQLKNPTNSQRSEAPLKLGTLSGKEIMLIGQDGGVRLLGKVRILNDHNSVVCLVGAQKGSSVNGGALNRFLNSAQLGPLPAELRGSSRPGR